MLQEPNELSRSFYEAKKVMRSLGIDYKKIHACPNNCILYRGEYKSLENCPKCGQSQWKLERKKERKSTGVPEIFLWYLPPILRFNKLFHNISHVKNLTWHKDGMKDDSQMIPFFDIQQMPCNGAHLF